MISVMLYVQHLLGIGHQRRTAAIARALGEHGFDVCYVSGGLPVPGLALGNSRFVQLPPARAMDARYDTLVGADGEALGEEWRRARRRLLLQTFEREKPHVVMMETFPFGRRMFRFELLAWLEAIARVRPRPLVISSVRDILEPKRKPGRNEESLAWAEAHFDWILVHADPRLARLEATFPLAARLNAKLRYTGYVVEAPDDAGAAAETPRRDEVVVSAGGGVAGQRLLDAALAAPRLAAGVAATWRLLVGPNLPERSYERLRERMSHGVVVERNRPDFQSLLRTCRVSVSQAGYNTVFESLAAGARMVLAPFSESGEAEQLIRARQLADRGWAEVLDAEALCPENLAAAVTRASRRPWPNPSDIDLGGARSTARWLATVTEGRHRGT